MFEQSVKIGLYRHFKGSYYFLENVMKSDNGIFAQYFNVLRPDLGYYCRPYTEWFDTVLDREDNVTGQTYRFEFVKDLEDGLKNVSTDHLVRELNLRKDNPYLQFDLKGMNDLVSCTDWCIGEYMPETKEHASGVMPCETFDSYEEAKQYFNNTYVRNNRYGIFKRVFIQENTSDGDFDEFLK